MHIESLATGVAAKGLRDLLAGAEELMRQDKFTSAIDRFNQAGRVAPNNSMITLGRGIAELGAGYYAQSERDLRQVFRADPALLMAQIDLGKMMNADRLQYLRNDLSNLAASGPRDERPWFLQAFIAYNTGNQPEAERDLSEAEKRSGRADAVIRMMRSHWNLKSDAAAPTTQPELSK
jgi:predicted Zn-dependent protease